MNHIIDLIKPNILSEISRDIGQVFFAGMVVAQITEKTNINWFMISGGLILSLISWIASIIIISVNK